MSASADDASAVRPRLVDFGLARDIATGSRYTRTGQALGTPAYMSPEQARGETAAMTSATDVWALGCVLHELLAGRRAFDGDTPAEVIAAVLTREPPPLRQVRPDAPPGLDRVVRVCLTKRAGHRYVSARELRDELDRVLRGEAVRARPRGRRPVAIAVGLALLVVALLLLRGPRGPIDVPPPPVEALAARAWDRRAEDPAAAAEMLGRAIAARPDRTDWRVQRGLLLWAAGQDDAAQAAWREVPATGPESMRAAWYRGFAALVRAVDTGDPARFADADPHLHAAARGTGTPAALARAALALRVRDFGSARPLLQDLPGWDAAFLRALVEVQAADGDVPRGIRELDLAMREGLAATSALAMRGACRHRLGDFTGAEADYGAALARRPRWPEVLANRAAVRAALGEGARALADCEAALVLRPEMPEALATRGALRATAGRDAEALPDLDLALARRPELWTAWRQRGRARHALRDLDGAIADFDEALRRAPEDPPSLLGRAFARAERGDAHATAGRTEAALADWTTALTDYERGLVPPCDEPVLLGRRGRLKVRVADALRLGGRDAAAAQVALAALADFDRALRLGTDDLDARLARARLLRALGDERADARDVAAADARWAAARQDVDAYLQARPTDAAALDERAQLRQRERDRLAAAGRGAEAAAADAAAREDVEAALRADPRCASALHHRGVVRALDADRLEAAGQADAAAAARAGARSDYAAALAITPGAPDVLVDRAVLRAKSDDAEGALADLDAAVAAAPTLAIARFNRAFLRAQRSEGAADPRPDLAAARADLEAVVEAAPGYPGAHGMLGMVCRQQQDWTAAVRAFRTALQLEPPGPRAEAIRRMLATAEAAAGAGR